MKTFQGLNIPSTLEDICRPEKMALLIYDMQVGIVPQIPDGKRITDGCQALVSTAKQIGIRVFYTRHISLPVKAAGVTQIRRSMIWQHKDDPAATVSPFLATARSSSIVPELAPSEDDIVIEKITMSAFEGTFLNIAFRDLGLQSFAVAGIALDIGIEPTVRHALDLNYIPVVVSDLCGTRTEDLHKQSMSTLAATGEVFAVTSAQLTSTMKLVR